MRIEPPEERRDQRPMTEDEARAFMRSWYRVVEGRGTTMAYVPDRATAERVLRCLGGES